MRVTVERMRACGDSQETIARGLGIDEETLRKHFGEELKNGYANRRREIVDMLFKGAAAGNATLIKRLEEMTRLSGAAADFEGRTEAKAPRAPKPGKKEIARQDAFTAGADSDWGDDLKPPTNTLPN